MAVYYRRFGTKSIPSSWTVWPLKMERIGCPETSLIKYHSTLRKIPKESRFQSMFISKIIQNTNKQCGVKCTWHIHESVGMLTMPKLQSNRTFWTTHHRRTSAKGAVAVAAVGLAATSWFRWTYFLKRKSIHKNTRNTCRPVCLQCTKMRIMTLIHSNLIILHPYSRKQSICLPAVLSSSLSTWFWNCKQLKHERVNKLIIAGEIAAYRNIWGRWVRIARESEPARGKSMV
jgi:hypothetical protein